MNECKCRHFSRNDKFYSLFFQKILARTLDLHRQDIEKQGVPRHKNPEHLVGRLLAEKKPPSIGRGGQLDVYVSAGGAGIGADLVCGAYQFVGILQGDSRHKQAHR